MSRRTLVAGVATAVAMVVLVLAASSGPGRIWVTPPAEFGTSSGGGDSPRATIAAPNARPTDHGDASSWGGFFSQFIGVLLIVFVITAGIALVRIGRWPRPRWRGRRARQERLIVPLPEVLERELSVDVDAARVALAEGSPRNAIVSCWMQLERDAAAAGLPRAAAETAAEYVERVVAGSSLDPAPIQELAALYREARFSSHELSDDHRARAFQALNRVEAELRRSVELFA